MTNWQVFKRDNKYILNYFHVPKVVIVNERDQHLSKNQKACGYYDAEQNKIILLEGNNIFPIRLHEYGHWLNALMYCSMEVVWEFFWWGLSIRSLFVKELKP